MSTISGISSQTAIDTLVQQTIATSNERKSITSFETQKKDLNSRLNIFTDLKGFLSALQDRVKKLKNSSDSPLTSKWTAVSSKESILTAQADKTASTGVHSFFVERLAVRDTGVSKQMADPETSTVIASRFEGTTQTFTIGVGSEESVEVSIEFNDPNESDASVLKRIRDAINNAGISLSASYTKDTQTTARLTLTSLETGSDNAIILEDAGGSDLMRQVGFISASGARNEYKGGTGGGFLHSDISELDARFKMDGITIERSTNVITDLLEGVTITLKGVQESGAAEETLTIDRDTAAMKDAIKSFVEEFNTVIKYINDKTSVNTTTYVRGVLAGDFQITNLRFQLRDAVTRSVAGLGPGLFSSLPELGIDLNREGVMSIEDEDALAKALESNPARVAEIFTSSQGISSKIESLLSRFVSTGGVIDNSKKGVSNKITYINTQIDNYESRLAVREQVLRRQYATLQSTLSQLQSQESMLSSITSNISSGYSSLY